jgi:hypothetical protein
LSEELPIKPGTFVLLYFTHILTTVLIPIALLELGLVSPIETLSLILLIAGVWTLIGTLFLESKDTSGLRRAYLIAGLLLLGISAFLYLSLR